MIGRHGPRAARFGVVGVLCAITDFSFFAGLVALGAPVIPANVVSFLIANVQGYVLNAKFSFKDGDQAHGLSLRGYVKFFAAYAASLVLSTAAVAILAGPIGPLAAKVVATVFAGLLNYLSSAYLVFRRPPVGRGDDAESM
jgi:putative flippase GtrA